MMTRITALIVVGMLTACAAPSGSEGSESHPSVSPPDPSLPFMHVRVEPDAAAFDSLVSGVLRVNAKNCVVLDRSLISAPLGSHVLDDRRISFAGVGVYRLGDHINTRGVWSRRGLTAELARRCGVTDMAVLYPLTF